MVLNNVSWFDDTPARGDWKWEFMCGKVCCPSTFALTKLTMQTQSSHHVRTSIDQHGEQSINRDAESTG